MSRDSDPGLTRILKLSLDAAINRNTQAAAVTGKLPAEHHVEGSSTVKEVMSSKESADDTESVEKIIQEGLKNIGRNSCLDVVIKRPHCRSGRGRGRNVVDRSDLQQEILPKDPPVSTNSDSQDVKNHVVCDHSKNGDLAAKEVVCPTDENYSQSNKQYGDMEKNNSDVSLKNQDISMLPDLVRNSPNESTNLPKTKQLYSYIVSKSPASTDRDIIKTSKKKTSVSISPETRTSDNPVKGRQRRNSEKGRYFSQNTDSHGKVNASQSFQACSKKGKSHLTSHSETKNSKRSRQPAVWNQDGTYKGRGSNNEYNDGGHRYKYDKTYYSSERDSFKSQLYNTRRSDNRRKQSDELQQKMAKTVGSTNETHKYEQLNEEKICLVDTSLKTGSSQQKERLENKINQSDDYVTQKFNGKSRQKTIQTFGSSSKANEHEKQTRKQVPNSRDNMLVNTRSSRQNDRHDNKTSRSDDYITQKFNDKSRQKPIQTLGSSCKENEHGEQTCKKVPSLLDISINTRFSQQNETLENKLNQSDDYITQEAHDKSGQKIIETLGSSTKASKLLEPTRQQVSCLLDNSIDTRFSQQNERLENKLTQSDDCVTQTHNDKLLQKKVKTYKYGVDASKQEEQISELKSPRSLDSVSYNHSPLQQYNTMIKDTQEVLGFTSQSGDPTALNVSICNNNSDMSDHVSESNYDPTLKKMLNALYRSYDQGAFQDDYIHEDSVDTDKCTEKENIEDVTAAGKEKEETLFPIVKPIIVCEKSPSDVQKERTASKIDEVVLVNSGFAGGMKQEEEPECSVVSKASKQQEIDCVQLSMGATQPHKSKSDQFVSYSFSVDSSLEAHHTSNICSKPMSATDVKSEFTSAHRSVHSSLKSIHSSHRSFHGSHIASETVSADHPSKIVHEKMSSSTFDRQNNSSSNSCCNSYSSCHICDGGNLPEPINFPEQHQDGDSSSAFASHFGEREFNLPAESIGSKAAMDRMITFLESCSTEIEQYMARNTGDHPVDVCIKLTLKDFAPRRNPCQDHPKPQGLTTPYTFPPPLPVRPPSSCWYWGPWPEWYSPNMGTSISDVPPQYSGYPGMMCPLPSQVQANGDRRVPTAGRAVPEFANPWMYSYFNPAGYNNPQPGRGKMQDFTGSQSQRLLGNRTENVNSDVNNYRNLDGIRSQTQQAFATSENMGFARSAMSSSDSAKFTSSPETTDYHTTHVNDSSKSFANVSIENVAADRSKKNADIKTEYMRRVSVSSFLSEELLKNDWMAGSPTHFVNSFRSQSDEAAPQAVSPVSMFLSRIKRRQDFDVDRDSGNNIGCMNNPPGTPVGAGCMNKPPGTPLDLGCMSKPPGTPLGGRCVSNQPGTPLDAGCMSKPPGTPLGGGCISNQPGTPFDAGCMSKPSGTTLGGGCISNQPGTPLDAGFMINPPGTSYDAVYMNKPHGAPLAAGFMNKLPGTPLADEIQETVPVKMTKMTKLSKQEKYILSSCKPGFAAIGGVEQTAHAHESRSKKRHSARHSLRKAFVSHKTEHKLMKTDDNKTSVVQSAKRLSYPFLGFAPGLTHPIAAVDVEVTYETTCSSPSFAVNRRVQASRDWARLLISRSKTYEHTFIDCHCHIDIMYSRLDIQRSTTFAQFRQDHADTFPRNYEGCVAVFCHPSTFAKDNPKDQLLKSVATEDGVWLAVGCHPKHATDFEDTHLIGLKQILKHPKVVALGEIGLDYSGTFIQHSEKQKQVFKKQLQLAVQLKLPIVIHCREADDDCLAILIQTVPFDHKIHAHCFTRDISVAMQWLAPFRNLFLGLTPLITYQTAEDAANTAIYMPLDRLLLETDAPYFLPRSAKTDDRIHSHPGFALCTAERVAELKCITVDDVLKACRENTRKMYGI